MQAELQRNYLLQLGLHRQRGFALGQPEAIGHAENVRVHRDGVLPEGHVEHHIGGFAAHARQRFQRLAATRHFAAVLVDQDAAGGDDVFRLGFVQPDGADRLTQPVFAEVEQRLRGVGHGEQRPGGLVHADIGGLSRKRHRDQQLEGRAVFQLGARLGVGGGEALEQGLDLGGFHAAR